MTELNVAHTILSQLGPTFSLMTGAKDFVGSSNSLTFRLPKGAKRNINSVKITLNGNDLYDVDFVRIWGTKLTPISRHTDIYFDMLQDLFESETGLFVILNRRT